MLITQIMFLVTFIYWIMAYSYVVLTPSILISNNYLIKLVKKLSQTLVIFTLIYGFKTKFYLTNTKQNIKELINQNTDLVDIVICNHITTIDFLIVVSYLKYLGITSTNILLNYKVKNLLGIGLVAYANTDIKVFRNWELDQDNILKQIGKFNNNVSSKKEVLIIFPEGTRYTKDKFDIAQNFSKSKGIPVYDNLLVPKARGLWFLINNFKKANKLGRVWDITLTVPSILGKSGYIQDLIGKPVGPVYGTIKELNLDINYEDLDIFKSWLFKNWKNKDYFMQYYKNFIYKKLHFNNTKNKHLVIIALVCLIFSLLLGSKYGRYYLIISLLISYIMIIFYS